MDKNTFLKTHTFGDLIKWMGYSNPVNSLSDIIGTNDPEEIAEGKKYLNKSLLSMTNLVFFDSIERMVNNFYEDIQMSKLSSVILPLLNPITEELESYVLDYDGKAFIILEPREAEAPSKEFELRLDEAAFIDYLKEKGEDPFTAQEIADNLKEEKKMASLLKLAKEDDISFDTKADLRIWIDLSDFEFDDKIQEIKNMSVTLAEKIRLAKDYAKSLAIDNLNRLWSKNNIYVNQYTPLEETFDRIDWVGLLEGKE